MGPRYMTFVDSSALMYAVGKPHPLQAEAQEFFVQAIQEGVVLSTSAEVLQEMLHVYKSTGRIELFENALALVTELGMEVWPLESEDVLLTRQLHVLHPGLSARDLCHLTSCRRRGVREIKTFDEALGAVVG